MTRELEIRTVDGDLTPIWQCLLAQEDPYPRITDAVNAMLRPGGGGAMLANGPWSHAVDRRGGLMLSALLYRPERGPVELRATYPYTESGYLWPMRLQALERSSDGGTAVVLGHAGAASMGLFDTMHFRSSYRAGETYRFQVSGIALGLHKEPVRFAPDFCGFANLRQLTRDPSQPADVVELHSIVQATEPATFCGVPLTRYLLSLAKTPELDLTFDVYGNDDVIGRHAVGDRVAGHAWIFGFHPRTP
jgi:hypothetical protein